MRSLVTASPAPIALALVGFSASAATTYFETALQRKIWSGFRQRLVSGGILVIGKRESLRDGWQSQLLQISPWGIYRRASDKCKTEDKNKSLDS